MNVLEKKLAFACRKGNLQFCESALEGGASPDVQHEDGRPVLVVAASHGHADVCLRLIEAGARAREDAVAAARAGGHLELADRLVAVSTPSVEGVDPREQEWALIKAAKRGDLASAVKLLMAGVDPSTPTQIELPRTHAASAGNLEMMDLLKVHASRLQVDRLEPPLVAAARGGRLAAVERLLQWGAEVDAVDIDRSTTALSAAVRGGHAAIVERLLAAGADRKKADARRLAELTRPIPTGATVLTEIAFASAAQVARWLQHDPQLARARDEYGYTVLHNAVHEPVDADVVELLVRSGADVRARTDDGIEPIHLARAPLVQTLVRLGADVDARCDDGSTPLMVWATEQDELEPMRALLAAGADPSLARGDGETARSLAARRQEPHKLALLDRPPSRT